jgi:DNA repair exonuclease SbcCD ATPase subunit
MKSKAATAGWDAAANAEEKLDLEMEKAYQRGVTEGKKMNVTDLQSVHQAIEAKEQKIIELIEKCADGEKKVMKAEKEMEEMEKKVRVAEAELEKARSQQHHDQQGQGLGQGNQSAPNGAPSEMAYSSAVSDERIVELEEELEKSKERLDETQEEMVTLSEQVEELQQALQLSEQKIQLLEQMVTTAGATGTAAPPSLSSSLPASGSSSLSQLKADGAVSFVDGIVNHIRVTIEKVPSSLPPPSCD